MKEYFLIICCAIAGFAAFLLSDIRREPSDTNIPVVKFIEIEG